MNEQERRDAPAHAGSGESFPLGPGCAHVKAAWDLRGHGNKASHERRIRAYAKAHGCDLPDTAKKGLDEGANEEIVHKAFNPVGKTWLVEKAWETDDGSLAIEGWVSTPDRDIEKDIVEPEAFYGETFEGYYKRSAPLSSNHDTDGYPIGHLQKGVLVREGIIFQEEYHPTDPAEFQFFDPAQKATGWYARGVITDPRVATHVKKGNMGAFSWIGNLKAYEPLVGGGRRYHEIDPLLESTVAAYPVNPKAVMRIAKAYGLEEPMEKNPEQNPFDLETLMVEAGKRAAEAAQKEIAAKGVPTAENLGDILLQFEKRIETKLEEVKKAIPALPEGVTEVEEENTPINKGVGRKSTVPATANPFMDNPVKHIVQKGRTALETKMPNQTNRNLVPEPEYTDLEKSFIWDLTKKALSTGMSSLPIEGDDFADEYSA